jgi:hypothetical protein
MLCCGTAFAQEPGARAPREAAEPVEIPTPSSESSSEAATPAPAESAPEPGLFERFRWPLSQEEDPDGPISTDRPTFTPANTTVPRGRLQFESGFTFNSEQSATTRSTLYDLPELALRFGLTKKLEFRTFWTGQTWIQTQPRFGGPFRNTGGLSDMEVGFKWQLLTEDKDRKWIPITALITSIYAPTGGTSILGSHTVQPYVNLIYGWNLTKKLTFGGSTGYLGMKVTDQGPGVKADSFERFHQSLLAFYTITERTTLFYEWYVWTFTNAADNRPLHFMDGGALHRLTPNIQLDLRAGFGLTGRPDDFFTGAGLSFRF